MQHHSQRSFLITYTHRHSPSRSISSFDRYDSSPIRSRTPDSRQCSQRYSGYTTSRMIALSTAPSRRSQLRSTPIIRINASRGSYHHHAAGQGGSHTSCGVWDVPTARGGLRARREVGAGGRIPPHRHCLHLPQRRSHRQGHPPVPPGQKPQQERTLHHQQNCTRRARLRGRPHSRRKHQGQTQPSVPRPRDHPLAWRRPRASREQEERRDPSVDLARVGEAAAAGPREGHRREQLPATAPRRPRPPLPRAQASRQPNRDPPAAVGGRDHRLLPPAPHRTRGLLPPRTQRRTPLQKRTHHPNRQAAQEDCWTGGAQVESAARLHRPPQVQDRGQDQGKFRPIRLPTERGGDGEDRRAAEAADPHLLGPERHHLLTHDDSIAQVALSHGCSRYNSYLMEPPKLVLFSYFRSSTAWRTRIVLNHKQIPHEFRFVHLVKGEQKSEEYRKVNPNGAVPALLLPTGQVLIESMAICEYLEETHPDHPLLPKDPVAKAQVRGFCEVVNSGMHPYQNLRLLEKVGTEFGADKMKFAKDWVLRGMDTFEAMLEKTKGKYCFGDELSLADCFFYPQVQGGINRFGVDIDKYPHSKHVLRHLQELEAFRLAEPKNQPDFEA